MFHKKVSPVIDLTPYPHGSGFEGGREWWNQVRIQNEKTQLDALLGAAMLDSKIHDLLVHKRDESLMVSFGLSSETCQWLKRLKIGTINELAQAIVKRTQLTA